MRAPEGSEKTIKQILTQEWERTGRKPAQLDIEPIPEGMTYLVGLFWECKLSRDSLTWSEMESWLKVSNRELEFEEVRALMLMESIRQRVSETPLTEDEVAAANKSLTKARLRAALRGAGKRSE
jgi:hypothetical protein